MPSRPDVPCNRCGELMWRGTGSRPEGKARCLPCRRIEPQRGPLSMRGALIMCPWCWEMFVGRRRSQSFCNNACASAFSGERRRVRAANDQHQERCEREKNAPGLGRSARRKLLFKWRRQRKTCAYCDEIATTLDHVLSLIRGGNNYEGNLAPCCRLCNSSKAGLMVIEWRTGKRLPRMGSAIAWQSKVRPAKVIKVKPDPVLTPCGICATPTTNPRCCSDRCASERNGRVTRDTYRTRVGLPVDADRPTKKWVDLLNSSKPPHP